MSQQQLVSFDLYKILLSAKPGRSCHAGDMEYASGDNFYPSCNSECFCVDGNIGCRPPAKTPVGCKELNLLHQPAISPPIDVVKVREADEEKDVSGNYVINITTRARFNRVWPVKCLTVWHVWARIIVWLVWIIVCKKCLNFVIDVMMVKSRLMGIVFSVYHSTDPMDPVLENMWLGLFWACHQWQQKVSTSKGNHAVRNAQVRTRPPSAPISSLPTIPNLHSTQAATPVQTDQETPRQSATWIKD